MYSLIHRQSFEVLPSLCEVPSYAYTSCAVPSTYTALIKLEPGADDAVTARPHTFPFHTHRAAVRATLRPIDYLNTKSNTVPNILSFYF